jgi:hypothetical protein
MPTISVELLNTHYEGVVLTVRGMLKLSFRQAEGRRLKAAVLCLVYFFALGLMFFSPALFPALGGAVFAALLIAAVCVKGVLVREAFALSQGFLNERREELPLPPLPAAVAGELNDAAFLLSSDVLMLVPSALCLRTGVGYYSLSSDRRGLMLLLAACLLLASAGFLFSRVIKCRVSCASFLRLSGRRGGVTAIDASWELTRDDGGRLLRLSLVSAFFGPFMSALCMANAAAALCRVKGDIPPRALKVGLVRNTRGELSVELLENA